jgi:hypothetical protein
MAATRGMPRLADARRAQVTLGLTALILGSAALRVRGLSTGYWTDEGIAVGIASHPLHAIPHLLKLDGSPPLYYLLLHFWMALFGHGEVATHTLSLLIALAAIPVAFWAGKQLYGARGGWLAATGTALVPLLNHYADETRMYSLIALLSLVVCASFALAFLQQRRRHLITLGVSMTLLVWTHNWGLFLGAGLGVCWLVLLVRGRVRARDGLILAAAVLALYAPWLPTLAYQATHTAAPWAMVPGVLDLIGIPFLVFGVGGPVLLILCALAARRPGTERTTVLVMAATVLIAAVAAWGFSQGSPAWATRYLAVLVGPIVLTIAGSLARAGRGQALVLGAVAVSCLFYGPPSEKSNVRTIAQKAAPHHEAHDVVIAIAPEDVPVIAYYSPRPRAYLTVTGRVVDPSVTDWRDLVARAQAIRPRRVVRQALKLVPPGGKILLWTPVLHKPYSKAPLMRVERWRTRQVRRLLRHDPRLQRVEATPASVPRRIHTPMRLMVYRLK